MLIFSIIGVRGATKSKLLNERFSQMKSVSRKLNDVEVTKLSFGCQYNGIAAYLFSYDYFATIDRQNCKFCKFVYSYKLAYDKTAKKIEYSDFVLDEDKSLFYLDGSTYCDLTENEYKYSDLKGCPDAVDYVNNIRNLSPLLESIIVENDEVHLYLSGVEEYKRFIYCTSSILYNLEKIYCSE